MKTKAGQFLFIIFTLLFTAEITGCVQKTEKERERCAPVSHTPRISDNEFARYLRVLSSATPFERDQIAENMIEGPLTPEQMIRLVEMRGGCLVRGALRHTDVSFTTKQLLYLSEWAGSSLGSQLAIIEKGHFTHDQMLQILRNGGCNIFDRKEIAWTILKKGFICEEIVRAILLIDSK